MTSPNRALVLIDVQQEYFDGPLKVQHPPVRTSLGQITAAVDAATSAGIPVIVVQHTAGDQAPIFNPTTRGFALHPDIESRRSSDWTSVTKRFGSVFADTGLAEHLHTRGVDTVTLVGYMTNNCVIASAAEAETHGIAVEVLSDATGAISISNDAGEVDARTVHETLMAVLHSNFAAVASTQTWMSALTDARSLAKGNLPASAQAGAARFRA